MAGELDTEEEIKDQKGDEFRVMKNFNEKAFLTSIIYSAKTPRAIYEKLKALLMKFEVKPELNDGKWKFTYTRESELDDE